MSKTPMAVVTAADVRGLSERDWVFFGRGRVSSLTGWAEASVRGLAALEKCLAPRRGFTSAEVSAAARVVAGVYGIGGGDDEVLENCNIFCREDGGLRIVGREGEETAEQGNQEQGSNVEAVESVRDSGRPGVVGFEETFLGEKRPEIEQASVFQQDSALSDRPRAVALSAGTTPESADEALAAVETLPPAVVSMGTVAKRGQGSDTWILCEEENAAGSGTSAFVGGNRKRKIAAVCAVDEVDAAIAANTANTATDSEKLGKWFVPVAKKGRLDIPPKSSLAVCEKGGGSGHGGARVTDGGAGVGAASVLLQAAAAVASMEDGVDEDGRGRGGEGDEGDGLRDVESGSDAAAPRRRVTLSINAKETFREWFNAHSDHPYPSQEEKQALAQEAGTTVRQVKNWFGSHRKRESKTQRRQHRFPEESTATFLAWFQSHLGAPDGPYPSEPEKLALAKETNTSIVQVETWFINHRKRKQLSSRKHTPKEAIACFRQWFDKNPYPSVEEKLELSKETDTSLVQVTNWFINHRKRVWKPSGRRQSGKKTATDSHFDEPRPPAESAADAFPSSFNCERKEAAAGVDSAESDAQRMNSVSIPLAVRIAVGEDIINLSGLPMSLPPDIPSVYTEGMSCGGEIGNPDRLGDEGGERAGACPAAGGGGAGTETGIGPRKGQDAAARVIDSAEGVTGGS